LAITVLQRLPLDKGARHAIAVVLRYAVALAGVVLACRTLSVRWSSVQWLAAGMTVGLGFGLQEIFANFVSGLILLFERPIRVGDIITLDDVTGAVTNIHIRATTVRNWDGKELIVPNKELITGRMLNWTLSDSVNRIVITVGVAYKSDTRRVRAVMMAAAREHPEVMDDPAPNATLEGFGDSALQFVLRCYVANLDVRLATIHELHETIHDRLNEAGIEIAFPQRELHIRSAEGLAALSPTDRRERRAEAA
jgi:potassium efflux system protein